MGSQEWYTPPEIVERVVDCLGEIDLDPCANPQKHLRTIPAKTHFDVHDNAFDKHWNGKVFINPPFAETGRWVARLQESYWSGNIKEAILLCLASVETRWFQWLAAQPLCLPNHRIQFLEEQADGSLRVKKDNNRATCLFYFGPNEQKFAEIFGEPFGRIYQLRDSQNESQITKS